jgi:steroid 5-alpha reductase family enzyme
VTPLDLLWCAVGAMAIVFAAVWAVGTRVRNYGFLDVAWSLSVAVLAPAYAFLSGNGNATRSWAFAGVGVIWSLRLGLHVLVRVLRHHPAEDPRYRTLRERWPGSGRFLLFFELQAFIAVIFSVPFLVSAVNPASDVKPLEWLGLAIALGATAGETVADRQAERFKRDPSNKAAVLNIGLWRYSRHPNYFFESMVWCGICLAALPSPYGWLTAICPVLILYFLLRVTGIPLTEAHSLEHRGEAYREYQRSTSRFIPWLPKQG